MSAEQDMQTDQPKDDGSVRPEFDLLPCPWCGGPADIEEIGGKDGAGASFSVGCHDGDGKAVCFGYQSLTSFARKSDAVLAWNTRSPAHAGMKEALEKLANAADAVGVRFFDTDTMEPEVEAMQAATQEARAALRTAAEGK